MANSKRFVVKNGLETQNIQFVTADGTEKIIATVLEDGTLSFSGTSGQLFSIVDSLTGSIFSVNDISGIPSIEVFDDGKVILAESTGNVGIGTITPTEKLHVAGNINIPTGSTYKINGVNLSASNVGAEPANANIQSHISSTSNPHSVTKTQVGLGNVDNTSDASKPVSTATQTALNLKANLAGPTFTGTVSGITASMVGLGNVTNESKATMFTSPTFTGTPVAPTATTGTNTTQVATTAFVGTAVSSKIDLTQKGAVNGVADLDAQGKIKVAQLPNAVFDSLYFYDTGIGALKDKAAFAITNANQYQNRSAKGYYWVANTQGAITQNFTTAEFGATETITDCSITNGSPTITLTPGGGGNASVPWNVAVGSVVTGTGIPANTTIIAKNGGEPPLTADSYTMSANATATSTTATLTFGYHIKTNISASEEGQTTGNSFTLEVGDWYILTGIEGTGTTIDPFFVTFAIVNNTYENASTTVDGIVRLSSATTYASLSGNNVITDGRLKTVIDNASFAGSAHTHLLVAGATDVTATASELNVLDGITATTAELNFTDGVTSNIQTQINGTVKTTGDQSIAGTKTFTGNVNIGGTLDLTNTGVIGALDMSNNSIVGVNNIVITDPGPSEGIQWAGGNAWAIYESPNDLTTNSGGNLQIVQSTTRRATFNTSGQLEIPVATGTAPLTVASTTVVTNLNADLLDGLHASAFVSARTRTDWNTATSVISNVIGELAWKNFGNGHTIFDASNSTAPGGTAKNNTNPDIFWSATYPTLMGWNGTNTFGVRVDSARAADSADNIDGIGFSNRDSTNGVTPNNSTINGLGYTSGISPTLLGQTDGGLYTSTYSANWIHQIYGDFRTGQIAVRGKNNGTWQDWRTVWDSANDGAGSTLDADLLDGNHASAFYLASNPSGYTTNTGTVTSVSAGTQISGMVMTITDGTTTPSIATSITNAANFRTAIGAGTGNGTVTAVTGTSPIASSGGTTPAISLSANYGDTLNPYASKTANFFLAAPNGAAGAPTFRAIVAADIPTLNQNTTGTSAGVVRTVAGTTSAELVRGNMADNDQARILVGGTATNAGFLEIATADDGTEPIHVRQYTGVFATLTRTATLLDGSGNTSFPGTVTGTRLISNIATGTAPLAVTSTTAVANLNADLLDGNHASAFALASHTHAISDVTGLQTSLDGKISSTEKGAQNGVATLDALGLIPANQLGTWVRGGIKIAGTMGQAANDTLGELIEILESIITNSSGIVQREELVGYAFVAANDFELTLGTLPTNTINGGINPGDEGDTTLPITLETGDILIVSNYFSNPPTHTYSFAVLNNTYGAATSSSPGIVTLSSQNTYANLSGNNVVTDGVLKTVIDNAGFAVASNYLPLTGGNITGNLNASGNVGIGTTSPAEKLHVVGDTILDGNVTVGNVLSVTGGLNASDYQFIVNPQAFVSIMTTGMEGVSPFIQLSSDEIILNTDDVTRMRILPDGNIGIGTDTPAVKLDVVGQVAISTETYPSLSVETTSTQTNLQASSGVFSTSTSGNMADGFGSGIDFAIEDDANVRNYIGFIGAVRSGADNSGRLNFFTNNAGTSTEKMTILPSGNVGIGTTAPLNKLDIRITGADSNNGIMITREDATTTTNEILGGIGFDSTDGNVPSSVLEASAYIAAFAAEDHSVGDKGGYLTFGTSPIDQDDDTVSTERMRIEAGGNIGIGTPSPSTILNVVTGSNADGIQIRRNTSITTANDFATLGFRINTVPNQANTAEIRGLRTNRVNLGDTDLVFTTSTSGSTPTEKMRIRDDGNIGIGTATPSAKLDVAGDIEHTGLTMTSGTNVDQLKETTFTSALTTAWTDVTGVSGTYLATGSHIVQIISNGEYYTGTLSWFSGTTTSTVADEIVLHRAGPAASAGRIFARVIRTSSAPSTLKLQVSGSTSISSHTMTFKFRRTI
jgi:hypothetical protein